LGKYIGVNMDIKEIDIKRNWEDACASIKCPYCDAELYVDTQNGWTKCDCGHTFSSRLDIYEIVNAEMKE
jgi:hypothetical protein